MNQTSSATFPARPLMRACSLYLLSLLGLLGGCSAVDSLGMKNAGTGQAGLGDLKELKELKVEPALIVRNSGSAAVGYYQIGRRYQDENRLHQAADAYRKAIAIDSGYVDAHSALGAVLAQQGQHAAAAAEFRLAIDLAPQSAYLHNNLGYLYYLQGNLKQAIASLQKAVAIEPHNPRSLANLALVRQRQGMDPGASVSLPSKPSHAPAASNTRALTAAEMAANPAPSFPAAGLPAVPGRQFRFEIADGSKASGLADALSSKLQARGLPAPAARRDLSHPQYRSVIHYRDGYRQEAVQMGATLDIQVAIAKAPSADMAPGIDLKLVVGRQAASRRPAPRPAGSEQPLALKAAR